VLASQDLFALVNRVGFLVLLLVAWTAVFGNMERLLLPAVIFRRLR
jgi:hypothetical protein